MTDLHLDDEALSAAIDEELDAARAEHLERCARCAGRLGELRAAAAAVAAPVPAAPFGAVDAAVEAALGHPRAAPARRFGLIPLVAAAAVLLAILVAVPLLVRGGNGHNETAARGGATESTTEQASAGDLGVVDAATLKSVVERRLSRSAESYAAAPAPEAKSAPATGGGAGAVSGDAATTAAPACTEQLHRETPAVLDATATWEGAPARVLAFRDGDNVVAYVIDPRDCRILHFVRFRPGS